VSYKAWNSAMPTTAAMTGVATASGVKTMLQVAAPSTRQLEIISWGYSVSVTPPGISTVELIQTDVAATVTAHIAAGVQPVRGSGQAASLVTLGTTATGYTATNEGSVTATRSFDNQQLGLAAGNERLVYSYQFMPDEERPVVDVSKFLRVRTTFTSTTPLFLCWVVWKELG
jgi:hypothetical protein